MTVQTRTIRKPVTINLRRKLETTKAGLTDPNSLKTPEYATAKTYVSSNAT